MKKFYFAGNWKMNLLKEQALALTKSLKDAYGKLDKHQIILAPPFLLVPYLLDLLAGSKIKLACQNASQERSGAFTGEVSPLLIADLKIDYVILGHSERRALYGETNALVADKVKLALESSLRPIVCIGETLEIREKNLENSYVEQQIQAVLVKLTAEQARQLLFAYEPVWAIGTGKVASPQEVELMHRHIKSYVQKFYPEALEPPVLYGGSVKPDNAGTLAKIKEVDGFLVGGASLEFALFDKIIQNSLPSLA